MRICSTTSIEKPGPKDYIILFEAYNRCNQSTVMIKS
jgi:hypothetical protein